MFPAWVPVDPIRIPDQNIQLDDKKAETFLMCFLYNRLEALKQDYKTERFDSIFTTPDSSL